MDKVKTVVDVLLMKGGTKLAAFAMLAATFAANSACFYPSLWDDNRVSCNHQGKIFKSNPGTAL